MRKEYYNNYVRVSKRTAEKAYNAGKVVLLAPVNANMNYIFFPGVYIDNSEDDIYTSFIKKVNAFEYYNCGYPELGKYVKYFVEEVDK